MVTAVTVTILFSPYEDIAQTSRAYRLRPLSDKQAALPLIARWLLGYRTLSGV